MHVPGFGIMQQPIEQSTAASSSNAAQGVPAAAGGSGAASNAQSPGTATQEVIQVPVQGRDVQRSTSASSRTRSHPPQTGGAWHIDRAGHQWRDPVDAQPSQSSHASWSGNNWDWRSNWDGWRDNDWRSNNWWSHNNQRGNSGAWHHSQTDTAPGEDTSAAPPPQGLRGNVAQHVWAVSPLLDRRVQYTARNRPFYIGARGTRLCAIACQHAIELFLTSLMCTQRTFAVGA